MISECPLYDTYLFVVALNLCGQYKNNKPKIIHVTRPYGHVH